MTGGGYLVIALSCGLATGIIGKGKGSSFWIWFVVGAVLPVLGLVAAILFRSEKAEPERRCTTCGKVLKLYVQVCPRCGTDLEFPKEGEGVRYPEVGGPEGSVRVIGGDGGAAPGTGEPSSGKPE